MWKTKSKGVVKAVIGICTSIICTTHKRLKGTMAAVENNVPGFEWECADANVIASYVGLR